MVVAAGGTVYGRRVRIGGEWFDAITEESVADRVVAGLQAGRGGRIITPNVDILRLANGHGKRAAEIRGFLADASLIVADGMPLIWASRLAGTPLPERVTGSGLIWTLSAALGRAGRSVFVLGGRPANAPAADGAHRAAATLAASCPGLQIAGHHAPPFGFEHDPAAVARILAEVTGARPDFVFVGLGFPKQERVISDLRERLPYSWFLGCGAAIGFVAGDCKRAPFWMQRSGLEWAHRLAKEPGRLAGRYLAHDAPYAVRLLAQAAVQRRR
jgi:N-acetylglucosaminyldiphosphoundecaprenol N-acetyl-beta-D-mannosaminyltransferase